MACYNPENRQKRKATWSPGKPHGRWRAYEYPELVARDKCSLDLFWLKDESLLDADKLADPDEIAAEIADDLRAALVQIEETWATSSARRPRRLWPRLKRRRDGSHDHSTPGRRAAADPVQDPDAATRWDAGSRTLAAQPSP